MNVCLKSRCILIIPFDKLELINQVSQSGESFVQEAESSNCSTGLYELWQLGQFLGKHTKDL